MLCNWNLNSLTYISCLHTEPHTDNFELHIHKLENMNHHYKPKPDFIMYGDIHLTESYHKQCLNPLLTTFNLTSIDDFPTRNHIYSSTMIISNIFISSSGKYRIYIEAVMD
jgi:hypothetical protein